jgi:hypothetical protein
MFEILITGFLLFVAYVIYHHNRYTYGHCNGIPARKHWASGAVEMKLEQEWVVMSRKYWKEFAPYKDLEK